MSDIKNIDKVSNEQEIDLLELAKKIWMERKFIFKTCGIAAVVGIVVAYSIPKEYSTHVLLAPEITSRSSSSSMSALAAMAGINIGGASSDALSPRLFPEIVSSTPFVTDLFEVEVVDRKGIVKTNLYDYMGNYQKSPWWSSVISAPFKFSGWVFSLFNSSDKTVVNSGEKKTDAFQLTTKEAVIARALKGRIQANVDNKTWVTSLTVTMQDPLISATIADTVTRNLQNYVVEYRTSKARKDLEYAEKLYLEAQQKYYEAQQKYAVYTDGNQNVVLQSYLTEKIRLQNEMNLMYSVYTQVAQQLQAAKAKVQEITPVFKIVEPASVPLHASKPGKTMILVGFVFLAGVLSSAWIIFKSLVGDWRKKAIPTEDVISPDNV